VDPSARVDASATVDPLAWIGRARASSARARAIGPRVQLGADVVVDPGVRLRDVIAWDGVRVAADAEHVVLAG
jgi:UDP-3-O-[3-hydroxymyristoyl] glucosamine N-acyltransferase